MRIIAFALALGTAGCSPVPTNDDIAGTYTLITASRRIVATGEVTDAYGRHPKGMIMYGKDGRMLLVITHDGRPKPQSAATMSDGDRAELFRTMQAYGGTYKVSGDHVEHHVDLSWDEIRAGTTVIRDIKRQGEKLTYVTRPAPFSADGKESVVTVVWQKVR
jgi:exopolysaccharide biosynthesis protein